MVGTMAAGCFVSNFMDTGIDEIITKLGLALLIGTVIGAEREYKNKSAGLRTIILICVGATLFTMISGIQGAEGETGRIASNIVTGIGFLGAGAILREGFTVTGLTTASSIWVAAALGMAVGAGEYYLALASTLVVLVVLAGFGVIQNTLERFRKTLELHVTFHGSYDLRLEKNMREAGIRFRRLRTIKKEGNAVFHYEIAAPRKKLNKFLKSLNRNASVKSFRY